MTTFSLNGQRHDVDVPPDTPLLWVLRDTLGLAGTKFGCGIAACGACTVHLNGQPVRACVTPLGSVQGQSVTTIEAMADDAVGALVQKAWVEHDVAQCGYCQSGQIMSAVALLRAKPSPSGADITQAMGGNLCRCGTYLRIQAAIQGAAKALDGRRPS